MQGVSGSNPLGSIQFFQSGQGISGGSDLPAISYDRMRGHFCAHFCAHAGQTQGACSDPLPPVQGLPMDSSPRWVATLRNALKGEHGRGWSVREKYGRVQITRRFEDGTRSAVDTAIGWDPAAVRPTLELIAAIRERMEGQQLGLRDAYRMLADAPQTQPGAIDWPAVVERYRDARIGSGQIKLSTWQRDCAYRMERALKCLEARPTPRDGRGLLERYRQRWCGAAGTTGRKRQLLDVAALLRFAVRQCGAADRWLPPDDLGDVIGLRETTTADTTPVKPDQLERLLEGITDPSLRLAVALVGLFGLRPAELMVARVEAGRLRVPPVKRNRRTAKTPKPARMVLPLDLPGMPGEGARVLAELESGLVPLPTAIVNARDLKSCGAAFRQYLDRCPTWQQLKRETPNITPYGLRHGYALRAHTQYRLSIRVAAALMGHDPITHQRHYGAWTDETTIEAELARAIAATTAGGPRP
jgi:integrase